VKIPARTMLLTQMWGTIFGGFVNYVVMVLQKLFGYSLEKATRLMLEVHHEGKSVVSHGTREKAEVDVARLHAAGLWATMERDRA